MEKKDEQTIKILEELLYKGESEKEITFNNLNLLEIEDKIQLEKLISEVGEGAVTDIVDFLVKNNVISKTPDEEREPVADIEEFSLAGLSLETDEVSESKKFETGIEGVEYIEIPEDELEVVGRNNPYLKKNGVENSSETLSLEESETELRGKSSEELEKIREEVEKNLRLQQEEIDRLSKEILAEGSSESEPQELIPPESIKSNPETAENSEKSIENPSEVENSKKEMTNTLKLRERIKRYFSSKKRGIEQMLERISPMEKLYIYLDPMRERWDRELEDLYGKFPPKAVEIIRDKRVKMFFAALIVICLAYEINYLPYSEKVRLQGQLTAERSRGQELQGREVAAARKLDEVLEVNRKDMAKFNELKKQLIEVEFKDPLELVEIIQRYINEFGMKIDSIGKLAVVFEKYDNTPASPPPAGKDGKTDENRPSEHYSLDKGISRIEIPYALSSDFLETTEFIHAIETGKAFIELSNSPITISLKPDGRVYTSFTATAYSEQLKLGEKSLKDKLVEDNMKIRRDFFSRVNNEPLRKEVADIKVISLRGKLYAVVKLKNGRAEALTEGKILKIIDSNGEEGEYLASILEKENEYIVTLKNIQTLDTIDFRVERLE